MGIALMIEEHLDTLDTHISWADLAKIAKLTPSAMSHFRKKGTELGFTNLIRLSSIYKNGTKTMAKWCLLLQKTSNVKCAFEYLSISRNLPQLRQYIISMKTSSSKEVRDWAELYSIVILHQERNPKFFKKLNSYEPKHPETEIMKQILMFYHAFTIKDFSTVISIEKNLLDQIDKIKDEFIRDSFTVRVNEVFSNHFLYNENNIAKARYYAEKTLSTSFCADFTLGVYYTMGMTFLFQDFDQCLFYLNQYKDKMKDAGRDDVVSVVNQKDIPFVKNVWNVEINEEECDRSELAHSLATRGLKDEAINVLSKALEEDGDSPFKTYYHALALNDNSIMLQALVKFIKKGNKFFAQLPYSRLKEDPLYKDAAKLLIE